MANERHAGNSQYAIHSPAATRADNEADNFARSHEGQTALSPYKISVEAGLNEEPRCTENHAG